MTTTSPIELSDRVNRLEESATLAMVQRVKEMRDAGIEVLGLTAGEPDFTPPKVAAEAGIDAIRAGLGRYTAAAGTMELRQAIVEHIRQDLGLVYQPSQIVVTNGAKIAIVQALLALVAEGDEVLVPTPCWTSYPEMVKLADARPVLLKCDQRNYPSVADLEAHRTPATRALLLNTPNNPTGAVVPSEVLREIGQWALEHRIAIISDEIYSSLVYDGAVHHSPLTVVPELLETSVLVSGMSKAYAMTGWRMGFLAGPPVLAKAVASLQSQLAGSPCAISQIASVAALRYGAEDRKRMRLAFEARRRMVVEALRGIDGLQCAMPDGAFYAFPALGPFIGRTDPTTGRTIHSGDDFIEVLLEADRVACIGGSAFGAPNSFRISFAAADEVLKEALRRIADRLNALQE